MRFSPARTTNKSALIGLQTRSSTSPQGLSRRYVRIGTVVLGLLAGFAAMIPTPADAATKKKPAKPTSKKTGKTPANPGVVTGDTLNPCPTVKSTTVATMKSGKFGDSIKIWENPDETKDPKWTLGIGTEIQGRVTFTVFGEQGDWYNASVAARPNGSAGWIRKADVTTFQNPFYMVVQTRTKLLTVCNAGRVIQRERVAVGKSTTETPTGTFFFADLIKPAAGTNGPYGPYALGLSGFSETIFSFGASGDGRIGIHGTNDPGALGTAASSGCIRVSNAGITKIATTIFLGTPVRIEAT
jgi:lipoprotein-anchoring transpeptidase ErfK/SrfK